MQLGKNIADVFVCRFSKLSRCTVTGLQGSLSLEDTNWRFKFAAAPIAFAAVHAYTQHLIMQSKFYVMIQSCPMMLSQRKCPQVQKRFSLSIDKQPTVHYHTHMSRKLLKHNLCKQQAPKLLNHNRPNSKLQSRKCCERKPA